MTVVAVVYCDVTTGQRCHVNDASSHVIQVATFRGCGEFRRRMDLVILVVWRMKLLA